jgi:hypothetical protein
VCDLEKRFESTLMTMMGNIGCNAIVAHLSVIHYIKKNTAQQFSFSVKKLPQSLRGLQNRQELLLNTVSLVGETYKDAKRHTLILAVTAAHSQLQPAVSTSYDLPISAH